jgi:hypothetical protein
MQSLKQLFNPRADVILGFKAFQSLKAVGKLNKKVFREDVIKHMGIRTAP